MKKLTYEHIYNYFKEYGCELLESIYVNNRTLMKYKCSCNKIDNIRFDDFKGGKRCKECGYKKLSVKFSYSQEYVNQTFQNAGCECLDTYKNNHTKMKYKCSCGNISYIQFNTFLSGCRCKLCANKKISESKIGNKNFFWNPNRELINSVKSVHKNSIPYKRRYRKVYNITDSNLHVDHIFPVKIFVEYNIFDLDIINAEDNLQILSAKDNLLKSDKCDELAFLKYLESKGIII